MKIRFFYKIIFTIFALLLNGCAGYHFNNSNNPLIGYDIKTIAVPMFVNRSVLPQLAGPLTKEITLALNEYSGLKVVGGDSETADAVLIGVIESLDHYNESVKNTQNLFTEGDVQTSIGSRTPFYYPVQTTYAFTFRFILIKRPTKSELDLLTSDLGKNVKIHPKIVLADSIPLTGTFSRVVGATSTTGSPGEVNFVKNKGIFEKSLKDTCYQAAQNFKQVVLNAF